MLGWETGEKRIIDLHKWCNCFYPPLTPKLKLYYPSFDFDIESKIIKRHNYTFQISLNIFKEEAYCVFHTLKVIKGIMIIDYLLKAA